MITPSDFVRLLLDPVRLAVAGDAVGGASPLPELAARLDQSITDSQATAIEKRSARHVETHAAARERLRTEIEAQRDFRRFHGTTEAELLAWLREVLLNNLANFYHEQARGRRRFDAKAYDRAEKYFKKAIKLGLNMNYDLAMAKLSLAGIAMQKRRKREATMLLQEAKKLDKNNMLTDQIKMMQQQMKRI